MNRKNWIRTLSCSFITFIITWPTDWKAEAKQFPIGIVFDIGDAELLNAYTFAMTQLPKFKMEDELAFEFLARTEFISKTSDWCQTSDVIERQVCKNGVLALISAISSAEHLDEFFSVSHGYRVPVVSPWIPNSIQRINQLDFAVSPISLQEAILDMVEYYGYKKFIYLYHGKEGLHRLQTFYDRSSLTEESVGIAFAKRFANVTEYLTILLDIEQSVRWSFKFIVLDCPISLAKEVLLSHVREQSLGRRTYHYLVAGFAFDENWDHRQLVEISPLNVTGFRIIDRRREFVQEYTRKWFSDNAPVSTYQSEFGLSANVAFIHDSLLILKNCISSLYIKKPSILGRIFHPVCPTNSSRGHRQSMAQSMKILDSLQVELTNVNVEGLTGNIQFTSSRTRTNFSLGVMEIKVNGSLVKIGDWKEKAGYIPNGMDRNTAVKPYICATVLESPYMMLKEVEFGEPEPKGNDRFEGFYKDFADELARRLNVTFTFEVADGYGTQNSSVTGGWTGMIGELVRNEADIGIGAMTANSAREHAVPLSKSVMFLGISIMIFKPKGTLKQDIFAFMRPLSRETWICIGLAYVGVSVVLYGIAKYNLKELHSTEKQGVVKCKTQFSISNSLWFTFASLVGQGTDLCPRSISARLIGGVWWFLILIVTSSYTANFAAIQTVIRMEVGINSAADLAAQTKVKYGYLEGGATADFFKKTRTSDYRKMAEFIQNHKGVNVKTVDEGIARVRREEGKYAFLLESLKNKYTSHTQPCNTVRVGENLDTKGYVIGLSKSTALSMNKINTIILELRESGFVTDLEEKWLGVVADQCREVKDPKNTGRLSLDTLIGVFYILVAGLILAIIIQVVEVFYGWRKCTGKDGSNLTQN